jgi:hypothetical protein
MCSEQLARYGIKTPCSYGILKSVENCNLPLAGAAFSLRKNFSAKGRANAALFDSGRYHAMAQAYSDLSTCQTIAST